MQSDIPGTASPCGFIILTKEELIRCAKIAFICMFPECVEFIVDVAGDDTDADDLSLTYVFICRAGHPDEQRHLVYIMDMNGAESRPQPLPMDHWTSPGRCSHAWMHACIFILHACRG